MLTLSVLIYLIEFKNAKGVWSRFFDVFGKNALFIFVLSGVLPRLLGLIRIPGALDAAGKKNTSLRLDGFTNMYVNRFYLQSQGLVL